MFQLEIPVFKVKKITDQVTSKHKDVYAFVGKERAAYGLSGSHFIYLGKEYFCDYYGQVFESNVITDKRDKQILRGLFWKTILKLEDTQQITNIVYNDFIGFLEALGFNLYVLPDNETTDFMYVQGQILTGLKGNIDVIKRFVRDTLEKNRHYHALEMMRKGATTHYHLDKLKELKTIKIDPLQDDRETGWLMYTNTAVKITADKTEPVPYPKLKQQVWRHQILEREWEGVPIKKIMLSDWSRFLTLAWNGQEDIQILEVLKIKPGAADQQETLMRRQLAGMCAIGYMLHRYKKASKAKAIVCVDREDAETVNEANGGSGKSLTGKSLGHMRNRAELPGRQFKIDKSFVLSRVSNQTDLVHLVDMDPSFKIDWLFNWITDNMVVEKKNIDEYEIPFEHSPKWFLDTNYVPWGEGSSYRRRMLIIEYSNFFNESRTPETIFGKEFFTDWDAAEWAQFDNYNALCLQLFLRHGLLEFPTENWGLRVLRRHIGSSVLQFFESYMELDKAYTIKYPPGSPAMNDVPALLDVMTGEITENRRSPLDSAKALQFLRQWASYKGYAINGMLASAPGKLPRDQKRMLSGKRADIYTVTDPEDQPPF